MVDAVSLDAQGIARIAAAEPDVMLVDLGQTDAVWAARLLRGACPEAKLVAFALDEIDTDVFACAAAGFSSYVPRESSAEELLRALVELDGWAHALRAAYRGRHVSSSRRLLARAQSNCLATPAHSAGE